MVKAGRCRRLLAVCATAAAASVASCDPQVSTGAGGAAGGGSGGEAGAAGGGGTPMGGTGGAGEGASGAGSGGAMGGAPPIPGLYWPSAGGCNQTGMCDSFLDQCTADGWCCAGDYLEADGCKCGGQPGCEPPLTCCGLPMASEFQCATHAECGIP